MAATIAALLAVPYLPAAAEIFGFEPLPAADLLVAAASGLASVLWFDVAKVLHRSSEARRHAGPA